MAVPNHIRGLGYLRAQDLKLFLSPREHTPVLIRDRGPRTGPDIPGVVVERPGKPLQIIVMRYGMNALNVIDGVKKKLADIKSTLPSVVEIVSGYDRSGLIQASIKTLQRDLLEEAIIVSFVTIAFLFHFRSALIPILTLPIAVLGAFHPMWFLHVSPTSSVRGGAGHWCALSTHPSSWSKTVTATYRNTLPQQGHREPR
jgi:Cu(I)/Ag(I) efflux system membrane protein CusA/SilA